MCISDIIDMLCDVVMMNIFVMMWLCDNVFDVILLLWLYWWLCWVWVDIWVGWCLIVSELVFILSWDGVVLSLRVVQLEDGTFPTTTSPPSRRNRRFRNADMTWWNIRTVVVVLTSVAVCRMLHEHRRTRKPASKQCRRRSLRASAYHTLEVA